MLIQLLIILVFAFLLALFGVVNPDFIQVNLFGLQTVTVRVGLFVFAAFFAGTVFAGFLALFDQVKHTHIIGRLKEELRDLKDSFSQKVKEEVEQIKIARIKEEIANSSGKSKKEEEKGSGLKKIFTQPISLKRKKDK